MKKRIIYTVIAETGTYEDVYSWNVASYPKRQMAELHATKANEDGLRFYEECKKRGFLNNYNKKFSCWDKNMQFVDCPPTYKVEEIEFYDFENIEEFNQHYFVEFI